MSNGPGNIHIIRQKRGKSMGDTVVCISKVSIRTTVRVKI